MVTKRQITKMDSQHGNQMVSDEEILDAFDSVEGPYVTATELSDELPIGRHAVRKRLEGLHKEDVIGRKQPVPQFIGWWRYDDREKQTA